MQFRRKLLTQRVTDSEAELSTSPQGFIHLFVRAILFQFKTFIPLQDFNENVKQPVNRSKTNIFKKNIDGFSLSVNMDFRC